MGHQGSSSVMRSGPILAGCTGRTAHWRSKLLQRRGTESCGTHLTCRLLELPATRRLATSDVRGHNRPACSARRGLPSIQRVPQPSQHSERAASAASKLAPTTSAMLFRQLSCAIKCSHCAHQMPPLCPSNAATVPIKRSHCAHQTPPLCHKTQPLCHQMPPLCPSNAATVPSSAATVPIMRSHCAHQTQPLCPIKCSHCAHQIVPHQMLSLCPSNSATSNAATVPIKRSHCAIKCHRCAHQMQPLCPSSTAIKRSPSNAA
ncbi:hypothetical protein AB205_0039190, partial [Aquarana catesbeiana]